jgi:UDP-glucose 4-epimerase
MKRKRVIVTGGLGFIGSHLVEKLIKDNEVAIIDNKSTGTLKNIAHLTTENLRVIEGDITTLGLAMMLKAMITFYIKQPYRAFCEACFDLRFKARCT